MPLGKLTRELIAAARARPLVRECGIFLAFVLLTAVMTYPWVRHVRDTESDLADPYTIAYTLWWDYHQTLHDPAHLFDATLFYPYHDTLAFSEHDYGIALLFFPLFALGVAPLTVHSLATFFAFVFSGYGAFRLARTLTQSYGAAWVAGLVFAFIPYRFQRLPHLHYIFAGWIPLTFEALVLFVRARTWRRAGWLGAAYAMNALTCISWFVLTLVPLAASGVLLIVWHRAWRDPRLWVRGAVAGACALLVMLPFFLPYRRVAKEFGFVRKAEESKPFEALTVASWFAASRRSKVWAGLGDDVATEEVSLFPGLLPLLLPVAALLILPRRKKRGDGDDDARVDEDDARLDASSARAGYARVVANDENAGAVADDEKAAVVRRSVYLRAALILLDVAAGASVVVALFAATQGSFRLRLFGIRVVSSSHYGQALVCAALALTLRWVLSRTGAFGLWRARGFAALARPTARTEAFVLGALWAAVGFCGSFGTNFIFHRFLFEHVELFRSQRVPARWAMICYLGLALLSGLGATRLASFFAQHRTHTHAARRLVFAVLCVAVLADLWVAPLDVARGERLPDELTLRLKRMPMTGGLVYLPVFGPNNGPPVFEHMIRAADHAQPMITAASSFLPPLVYRISNLAAGKPVPDELMDVLESAPASYVVVTYSAMTPREIQDVMPFIEHGLSTGRLRFVRRFEDRGMKDLFAVVKNEPDASSEGEFAPPPLSSGMTYVRLRLPEKFGESAFFVCRLYRAAFKRAPTYAEFTLAAQVFAPPGGNFDTRARQLARELSKSGEFDKLYDAKGNRQFVETLYANAGVELKREERAALAAKLDAGRESRPSVLAAVAENEEFARASYDADFVLLHYFAFLERDPEPAGYESWLKVLKATGDHEIVTRAFSSSAEYVTKHPAR
ncbi:MAG: hypothetical protein QOF61_2721 [Acidobacteriota bacterium]|nr:hypothetical protein [Acidobacteriota bacterium]